MSNHDNGNGVALKRDRGGKAIRSKSRNSDSVKINQRGSCHVSSATSPLSDSMSALPFPISISRNEQQPQCESSQERPTKKFQRRSSLKKAGKRRASVTFAPLPPSTSSVESNDTKSAVQEKEEQHKGFRRDYSLGETVRFASHIIDEQTNIGDVNSLRKHDFAFVKRSDGSYSYAILACRSFEPIKGAKNDDTEECMTFVMNDIGSTKMIKQRHWSAFVCLVSMEGLDPILGKRESQSKQ